MADNVAVTPGSGATVAADDISSVFYQRVKLSLGADGSATDALGGAGTNASGVQRVTIATDDAMSAAVVAAIKAEDAAHSSGDKGIPALAVRNDTASSLSGTDGDYTPLTTNSVGALHVADTGVLALTKAEDAAHSSGDKGIMALTVRADTAAATSGTDGDYQPLITNSTGALHTAEQNVLLISKAEDAAHSSGDKGVMALAVRKDTAAALAGTDGDYAPLEVDANGRLHVIDVSGVLLAKAEDAAASGGDYGIQMLAVRTDAPAAGAGTDGDYASLQVDAVGGLRTVAQEPLTVVTITPTITAEQYAALDCVGGKQTLTSAARASGRPVTLDSLVVTSLNDVKPVLTIWFFNSSPDAGTYTDGGAPTFHATDYAKAIGKVNVASADYESLGAKAVAAVKNIGLILLPDGSANLYAVITITSGTPTFASTADLTFRFGFKQGN